MITEYYDALLAGGTPKDKARTAATGVVSLVLKSFVL